jgi:hypothetical protein
MTGRSSTRFGFWLQWKEYERHLKMRKQCNPQEYLRDIVLHIREFN